MHKAHREQDQISLQLKRTAIDGFEIRTNARTINVCDVPVLAFDRRRRYREIALRAFGLRGRRAHLQWPMRPRQCLVLFLRWFRHDL